MCAPRMFERYAEAREHLKFGSRKLRRGGSDVIVRESTDEMTLRAEEVNSLKALINVDHIELERWAIPWLMLTGMPSARRSTKALKGKIGKKCMRPTKK